MSANFQSLTIAEVRREIDDAVSLRFEVPDEASESFRVAPGQHLSLRAQVDGEELRRTYSICVAPHDGELRVAIKQVAGGRFSTWVNAALSPGHKIEVMPPHGSFTWRFSPERRATYAAFAGASAWP